MILTAQQAAEVAGVTDSHVRSWCKAGIVDAEQVGRFWRIDAASLTRHMEGRAADQYPALQDLERVSAVYEQANGLRDASIELEVPVAEMRAALVQAGYQFSTPGRKAVRRKPASRRWRYPDEERAAEINEVFAEHGLASLEPEQMCPLNCPYWMGSNRHDRDCLRTSGPCLLEEKHEQRTTDPIQRRDGSSDPGRAQDADAAAN